MNEEFKLMNEVGLDEEFKKQFTLQNTSLF